MSDKLTWTQEIMQKINELTPQVTGKSTDPDWFLLRQHFEFKEAELTRLRAENAELRRDKERLDRLESKSDGSSWIVEDDGYRFALVLTRRDMSYHPDARSTARRAIDAMQTEKEPT
jgi:1,4-alpha-glucan branching enzyme